MARPKSADPASPITITMPRSIKRLVTRTAKARKITASAFMLEIVKEYFRGLAEAMR